MAVDSGLHDLLYGAIQKKRLIRFRYQNKERIVEPHDYGIQKGIVRLFCWQVGGHSSSRLPGWRIFDLEGIENCEVLDRQFAGNREVSGSHHKWDEIFIRVAPPDMKEAI